MEYNFLKGLEWATVPPGEGERDLFSLGQISPQILDFLEATPAAKHASLLQGGDCRSGFRKNSTVQSALLLQAGEAATGGALSWRLTSSCTEN